MELYILDKQTLEILSVSNVGEYNINLDEETNGVSEFTLLNVTSARKGNYIVLNGLYKQFLFVITEDVFAEKGVKAITLTALDISNIFDRKIILRNKDTMTTTGIETFIANNIIENFANTDDSLMNLDYIDVYIHTNTKASVNIDDENGLYNFHTFLINCRQYKDIYTDFSINVENGKRRLRIDIGYRHEDVQLIDTTVAEVTDYNKVYEVDPVTKVECYIRENDSVYNLFLKSDRTTTTNKDDPDRLSGRIETISCDTADKAPEESLKIIQANRYKHLVEFSIAKTSKLVDVTQLYIGRPIRIKTEDSIYDSYISAITLNDENFVKFKSGNLRVDFTDKQRQAKLESSSGNKVDVSIFEKSKISNVGSNSRGEYIQFENGYMFVFQKYQVTVSANQWTQWGNEYTLDVGNPPDFPVSFKDTPPYVLQTLEATGNNGWLTTKTERTGKATISRAGAVQITRPTASAETTTCYINVFAIGKWK